MSVHDFKWQVKHPLTEEIKKIPSKAYKLYRLLALCYLRAKKQNYAKL